jgi:hypothetical protein
MDLANQHNMSSAIGRTPTVRGQIIAVVVTLALLAAAATWIFSGGLRSHNPGQSGSIAAWVSNPVNVEFRRGERQSLGAGTGSSVSDPVNVEFRRGEREDILAGTGSSVSDPVNVEFRRSERTGD